MNTGSGKRSKPAGLIVPRVSNDNAYAESVFGTCKYRPEYPSKGFATLDEARAWVARFVTWYNTEHRHSGLKFVTPEQRHSAQAQDIMAQRREVYEAARARNPQRWSGSTRNWTLPQSVWLNPEKSASAASAGGVNETVKTILKTAE